jgi:hypothetical protein
MNPNKISFDLLLLPASFHGGKAKLLVLLFSCFIFTFCFIIFLLLLLLSFGDFFIVLIGFLDGFLPICAERDVAG